MTRVLIVAEVRFYREALAIALARRAEIEVVGVASDRDSAMTSLQDLRPDLVLLSVSDALTPAFAASIRLTEPACRVVAIAAPEADEQVVAWVEAGVSGYVTQDQSLSDLGRMIASIGAGVEACSPRVTAALMRRVAAVGHTRPLTPRGAALTARETQILTLIDQGMTNKEIAASLTIELATVKNHVHSILRKVGVTRRDHATRWLREGVPVASGPALPTSE